MIGGLVAKTLTTSSTNPYAQGGAGARAAPVALDVFSVQVPFSLYVTSPAWLNMTQTLCRCSFGLDHTLPCCYDKANEHVHMYWAAMIALNHCA